MFHFFSVQHRLEEILGVPRVDVVERGAVHSALRERILGEAVNVA
jgi:predicted nucleotidyltransferase